MHEPRELQSAMLGDIPAFKHGRSSSTVIAADSFGDLGALFCLRTSLDGSTWTSDTIIVTRSVTGTWAEVVSGGTTFGAIDLNDPDSWRNYWTVAGDTVKCEVGNAEGTLRSATAVSGFCSPYVDRIHQVGSDHARQVTPVGTLRAFVVIAPSAQIVIAGEDKDGNRTRSITF